MEKPSQIHRKKCKRWNIPGHAHFLTFSCHKRQSLFFQHSIIAEIFLEELHKSRIEHQFALLAYVVMPSHAHILLRPQLFDYNISSFLISMKTPTSSRYASFLRENDPEKYSSMIVSEGRRTMFRFWQRGGGFDRNLVDEEGIRNTISYIEANPIRAGLVQKPEDWKFSSAHAAKFPDSPGAVVPDPFRMSVGMK